MNGEPSKIIAEEKLDSTAPSHLTSGRVLAKNTIWSLAGQLLPMVVAVIAIPLLVQGLGIDRFGVLSLIWVVIGYFSLFDLGIGRTLTKLVADKLGAREEDQIPALAWTSLLLMLLLGVLGAAITAAITPELVRIVFKIPAAIQHETLLSFYLLALSIPTVTVTSGLRGLLEAQQQFRIVNLIRIPMSVFSFVGPLLVLLVRRSLVAVVAVLLAGRIAGVVAHLLACFRTMPQLRQRLVTDRSVVLPVLRFGGWMTVSNVVGPIMVYMDRFLVGGLVSVGAVAYYTAPFDAVSRIWVLPAAVVGVLFPAFAVSLIQDRNRTALLLRRGFKYVVMTVFPVVLIVIAFAPEGLRLWLGNAFSESGSSVLRWLAAGVFVNSVAQIPFALIQGAGRPDVTAKFHLLELPFYLVSLWLMTRWMGIQGTAITWTGRCLVDACLLGFYAHRLLPQGLRFLCRLAATVAVALLVFYATTLVGNLEIRIVFALLILVFFAVAVWSWYLAPDERAFLSGNRKKVSANTQEF